jgi:hypothetical protein
VSAMRPPGEDGRGTERLMVRQGERIRIAVAAGPTRPSKTCFPLGSRLHAPPEAAGGYFSVSEARLRPIAKAVFIEQALPYPKL